MGTQIQTSTGDTLITVAKRYSITVEQLKAANPGFKLNENVPIPYGWRLMVPDIRNRPGQVDDFTTAPGRSPEPTLTGSPASTLQGATFDTPAGGTSANGNYQIPPCRFPTHSALTPVQRALVSADEYQRLTPEQRASFLNITGALAHAGIALSGVEVSDFHNDRIFLAGPGLVNLRQQIEARPSQFRAEDPKGGSHPGMSDWGVRQVSRDTNALQVGIGYARVNGEIDLSRPTRAFMDIDRFNPTASLVGLAGHVKEVGIDGDTNPFAVGKNLGLAVVGYTVLD